MSRRDFEGREAVTLRQVTRRYGSVVAVDGVDLTLARGGVTAILGPNGAGKTTLVQLMLGILQPDAGDVRLFGSAPRRSSDRVRTGTMLQVSGLPETLRVDELIDLFRRAYPAPRPIAEVLKIAGLHDVARRRYGTLSGGQKRRVQFALAICGDPELLFLDEPTTGLDVESRRSLWTQIRRLVDDGRSVVLTTHYLEEADALADRIVVLQSGRVVADGTPGEIKSRVAARRVRCKASLEPHVVQAIPGVQRVIAEGGTLDVLTSAAEDVVRRLLELDPALTDLEVSGAGIEEAFLALTQGDAADAAEEVA